MIWADGGVCSNSARWGRIGKAALLTGGRTSVTALGTSNSNPPSEATLLLGGNSGKKGTRVLTLKTGGDDGRCSAGRFWDQSRSGRARVGRSGVAIVACLGVESCSGDGSNSGVLSFASPSLTGVVGRIWCSGDGDQGMGVPSSEPVPVGFGVDGSSCSSSSLTDSVCCGAGEGVLCSGEGGGAILRMYCALTSCRSSAGTFAKPSGFQASWRSSNSCWSR